MLDPRSDRNDTVIPLAGGGPAALLLPIFSPNVISKAENFLPSDCSPLLSLVRGGGKFFAGGMPFGGLR